MSCIMLPAEHFAAMVGSVQAQIVSCLSSSMLQPLEDLASDLAEANAKAWNHRYKGADLSKRASVPAITPRMITAFLNNPLSVADTNQAIRCYQYQASDWDEWEGSKAERLSLYMQRALLDAESGASDVWVISEMPASRLERAMERD